jgi:glyoxylase-like metal-dependent hydrolase (beta-lactamase superfamily II)
VSIRDELQLWTIVSLPFEENTYVARRGGRDDCLVVDPGLEPQKIVDCLEKERLRPAAILITHGHSDHIAGNARLKQLWPDAPLVIGHGDAPKLTDPWLNLSGPFGAPLTSPPADVLLAGGQTYESAGFSLEVEEIPGHSSGHVVFVWKGTRPWIVFGGDVLFAGSVGRTDFADGSFEELAQGIHEKLFSLPDDTVVLPGHGGPTTIGEEKRTNPFVGAAAARRARNT